MRARCRVRREGRRAAESVEGAARAGPRRCGSVRRVRGERAALGRAGSGRVWGKGENGLGPRRGVGPGLLGWVWVSYWVSIFLFYFLSLFYF